MIMASAYAFNFTGKTFRGSSELADGTKATVTYVFRANNRLTGTIAQTGKNTKTYTNLYWEVSGGFINIYEPATGDFSYLGIMDDCDDDGDCEGVILIGYDSWGNESMYFSEVKSAPAKKTSKSGGKTAGKKTKRR